MLLALWPLFISTGVALPQQDISQLVTQYNESKYERAIKHEVSLSASTSQVQSLSAKFKLVAAPHKAFAFANTGQQQEVTGSIVAQKATVVAENATQIVSTHYQLNVATAQVQSISGAISASHFSSPILADNSIDVPEISFGNINTGQNQHIIGNIISNQPVAEVEIVSTHYQLNLSTAQRHEISGNILVTHYVAAPITVSVKAATYQQQVISGKITTNDDTEMMMVLLALIELDSDIG